MARGWHAAMNLKRKRPALPPASPLLRYATLLRSRPVPLPHPGLARRYIATVALPFKLARAIKIPHKNRTSGDGKGDDSTVGP